MRPGRRVTAFAPATVANVAVGFDILGFPVDAAGDLVTLEIQSVRDVTIAAIDGTAGCEDIPLDSEKNVCSHVVRRLFDDLEVPYGVRVTIEKGIPLSSGMGGSAASSVAALTAANHLLGNPLRPLELLEYAILGEQLATGSPHGDNVAPSMLGGLTLLRSTTPLKVEQLPVPPGLAVALVHPHRRLDTRASRAALGEMLPLKEMTQQTANLAGFIVGCFQNDLDLIGECLEDVLIEPRRAPLVDGFYRVKEAAMTSGALGMSLSGSGPAVFALCRGIDHAAYVEKAMAAAWNNLGIEVESWSAEISTKGAYIIEERD